MPIAATQYHGIPASPPVASTMLQNISPVATNCTTNRTLSGSDRTSSQKLIPAIRIRPTRNGR